MRVREWLVAGLAAVFLVAGPRGAAAGDARPPDADHAIDACRDLVRHEQWAQADAAFRKLFTDFPQSPRIRARLREIEDGLKVSLFRKAQGPLTGQALYGDEVKQFNASTRDITLNSGRLRAPLWTDVGTAGMKLLSIRLEGSFTIEAHVDFLDAKRHVVSALICYDIEKRGGYALSAGYYSYADGRTLTSEPSCLRIDRVGDKPLTSRVTSGGWMTTQYTSSDTLKIARAAGEITVRVGDVVVLNCADGAYSTGYVALPGEAVKSVVIRARADKVAYRKLAGEYYAARFADWVKKSYDRDAVVPAWAREAAVAAPDPTLMDLPSDAPPEDRGVLTSTVEAAAGGDEAAGLNAAILANGAPAHTALYLRGVAAIAARGYKDAAETLDRLDAAEPDFVPGRMFRGVARFHLRRIDEAKADLAWTLERQPRAGDAVVVSAILSIFEQDFAAADSLLAKADELGVGGENVDEVRDWVHRAETGPNFSQRFEHASDHFIVVSDHSKKVCYDAATLLESMQPQYAAALGGAPAARTKARVYVFSGPDGYFDYADDLHVTADSSAGVYLPMLRELAIWIPQDMTDFTDTVRHEGFHQYLHRFVDDAPIWFNEGYAGFMGGGGPEGVRDAKRDGEFVKAFLPVRELVAMKQPAFMKNAGVTYTESRYLVDFLRRTKNEKLRNVLRDYFAAVAAGLSQADANKKVLDPVMDVLESEFRRSY